MNENDEANLAFLMSISAATLADWYKVSSKDDLDYAMELLVKAEKNNMAVLSELLEPMQYDTNIDCTDAKQYLTRFTSKGTQ